VENKVEVLRPLVVQLGVKDQKFANDLIAFWDKKKRMSDSQCYWVGVLVDRATGKAKKAGPVEAVSELICGFEGVIDLFNRAKKHLKYPKIVLLADGQVVSLSLAGDTSKAPGTVNVTDGEPFGYNKWFGRVNDAGWWQQNPKIAEEDLVPVRKVLQELGEDPAATAKKYGQLTGRCCFCNTKLTDEHSTAAGFGPTCAKNYGMYDEWKSAQGVLQ
jgi:hypothetical protein